ncbi:UNVERIFIED_CONTAM: hypothetical protein GTU68_023037 [Idotea baltica]|nr:hypothetical protein [Idotea baltica]
MFKFIKARVRF